MSVTLTTEYKGYTIAYDSVGFLIALDGINQTKKPNTLSACIAWIDKKSKQVFTRMPVIICNVSSHDTAVREATATSYTEDAVWVVYAKTGSREMVHKSIVYFDTTENRELLDKISAEDKVCSASNTRKYALSKELEQFDVNVMTQVCDGN